MKSQNKAEKKSFSSIILCFVREIYNQKLKCAFIFLLFCFISHGVNPLCLSFGFPQQNHMEGTGSSVLKM